MAKSIKLKDNTYLDSTGVMHNRHKLSDILYPVGSIYMSVNNTNPKALFGGEWEQIKGQYLLAVDPNTNMQHKTSKLIFGDWNTGNHTLTVNEMPSHNHDYWTGRFYYSERDGGGEIITNQNGTSYRFTRQTGAVGGNQPHNHGIFIPPSFTVYVWYRKS